MLQILEAKLCTNTTGKNVSNLLQPHTREHTPIGVVEWSVIVRICVQERHTHKHTHTHADGPRSAA